MIPLILGFGLIGYASLVLMISVSVWVGVVRCLATNQPILETQPAPVARWGLLDIIGGTLGFIVLANLFVSPYVGGGASSIADLTVEQRIGAMWGQISAQSLVCLGIFILIIARGGLTLVIGDNWAAFRKDVLIGIATFCALCVPVILLQVVIAQFVEYKHELITMIMESPTPAIIIPVLVSAVLVAPLTEEFAFRLLLQGWLEEVMAGRYLSAGQILMGRHGTPQKDLSDGLPEERFSAETETEEIPPAEPAYPERPSLMVFPIFASSIIFALLHFGQGAAPIPLFFLALGLGYVYQKRRTIVPSLVVHMMLNGQSMLLLIFQIFFGESLEAPPV
ncbi:CAAX amino terminal protease self- immunity [Bremerella volcania]|uniref:CAAX amino terminal protease self-immunity n=1 Tax=Bremerella volcania TaxID=2527984 RepID=A0A518C8F5_9BACT|nr:CPBP family intramembrane glutamic endopeptidase [Bremerella volcania]QDU75511.1 CAAX amino terminal protease self- immunity [Bremerella volcania]